MRPRLAFLIRDLGYGGAQRQVATLARRLAAGDAFEPHVVSFYDGPIGDELRAADVAVHCVEKQHRWDLPGFFGRLVATLRKIRPALVHGYLAEGNLMATLTRPFCRSPLVVWGIRDSQTDAHQWGILGRLSFRLNVMLSSSPRGIIANSNAGRQWYRERGYPADDEDFQVIPNGIDVQRFKPLRENTASWDTLGVTADSLVIGIIGRLNPMKDHATFLEAAARVSAELPNAQFLIMGSGNESWTRKLRQQAAQLGLGERVIWSTPRRDLEQVYPALDLLVSSSAYGEGFSNVIAEAMACGIPCVATQVGDSAGLIAGTGWTCPPGDADALAASILHPLKLPLSERLTMGRDARTRIQDHFTIDHMVSQTVNALQSWGKRP